MSERLIDVVALPAWVDAKGTDHGSQRLPVMARGGTIYLEIAAHLVERFDSKVRDLVVEVDVYRDVDRGELEAAIGDEMRHMDAGISAGSRVVEEPIFVEPGRRLVAPDGRVVDYEERSGPRRAEESSASFLVGALLRDAAARIGDSERQRRRDAIADAIDRWLDDPRTPDPPTRDAIAHAVGRARSNGEAQSGFVDDLAPDGWDAFLRAQLRKRRHPTP